jgi:arsenate reductase (thioredoxin)
VKRVLFVCVENSCRSQLAEGLARKLGAGILDPHSAGSKPSGIVNPKAIAALKDRGIDISANKSKAISYFPAEGWHYVVTMGCGDACPFVPAKARLDWQIPDPKHMEKEEFSKVVDLIEEKVRGLLDEARRA